MQRLTESVYVETNFTGANVGFIVTSEGIIMVDAPLLPTEASAWLREMSEYGRIRYIVNTDHHRNHALGSAFFPGVVIAHKMTRRRLALSERAIEQLRAFLTDADPEGARMAAEYRPKLPVITFSRKLTLFSGQHIVQLIHLPGHTPNTIGAYLSQEKVLFTGDNLVNGQRPFLGQANTASWLKTLERTKAMDVEVMIPGHGPPCGKETLEGLVDYIRQVRQQVATAIAKGLNKEETIQAVDLLDRFPLDTTKVKEERQSYRVGIGRVYEEILAAG